MELERPDWAAEMEKSLEKNPLLFSSLEELRVEGNKQGAELERQAWTQCQDRHFANVPNDMARLVHEFETLELEDDRTVIPRSINAEFRQRRLALQKIRAAMQTRWEELQTKALRQGQQVMDSCHPAYLLEMFDKPQHDAIISQTASRDVANTHPACFWNLETWHPVHCYSLSKEETNTKIKFEMELRNPHWALDLREQILRERLLRALVRARVLNNDSKGSSANTVYLLEGPKLELVHIQGLKKSRFESNMALVYNPQLDPMLFECSWRLNGSSSAPCSKIAVEWQLIHCFPSLREKAQNAFRLFIMEPMLREITQPGYMPKKVFFEQTPAGIRFMEEVERQYFEKE